MEGVIYPLVSVVMICYNQEQYIENAILGVLEQRYGGQIELILANDRSSDRTDEIITTIIKNHHNGSWIKYTNHHDNKGMMENIKWALNQANGEFVALCEGDDYWIDPNKIQKQINFLVDNEEFSMCFHNAETINYSEGFTKEFSKIENREYDINEAYSSWMIPTASIVFKKEIIPNVILDLNDPRVFNWDIILILNCFKNGKVRGMADFMSIYRFGDGGLSILRMKKNKIQYLKNNLIHNNLIKEKFSRIQDENFDIKFFHIHMELAKILFNEKKPRFIYHLVNGLYYRPMLPVNSFLKFLKIKK